jgi:hypothetical protein
MPEKGWLTRQLNRTKKEMNTWPVWMKSPDVATSSARDFHAEKRHFEDLRRQAEGSNPKPR